MILGINLKVDCPNRPFQEIPNEIKRIENLTQRKYAASTQLAIQKFNLDIDDPTSLESCRDAGDYVISAYYNDPKYDWYQPGEGVYDVLEMCAKAYLMASFGSDDSLKLSGSPILVNITNHISHKVNSILYPDQFQDKTKYALYTGHQDNIVALLSVINHFDRECIIQELVNQKFDPNCNKPPGFSSNVIFELIDSGPGSLMDARFLIQIRVAGKPIILKNGGKQMSWKDWEKTVVTEQIRNWKTKCGLSNDTNTKEFEDFNVINLVPLFIVLGLLMLTVIMMIIVLNQFKSKRMKQRERFSHTRKSQEKDSMREELLQRESPTDTKEQEDELYPSSDDIRMNTINTLENGYSIPGTYKGLSGKYTLQSGKQLQKRY